MSHNQLDFNLLTNKSNHQNSNKELSNTSKSDKILRKHHGEKQSHNNEGETKCDNHTKQKSFTAIAKDGGANAS